MKDLGIKFEGWREAAQKVGRWFRRVEEGAEVFMRKRHKGEKETAGHAGGALVHHGTGPGRARWRVLWAFKVAKSGKESRGCLPRR